MEAIAGHRYCRRCNYNLSSLTTPRCPECAHPFNPLNPRTTLRRPARLWLRPLRRAAYALLTLFLLLAAVWGWFYWGWHDEQQALLALKLDPNNPTQVKYIPIHTPWPKQHLGPLGFVLDRVEFVDLAGRYDVTDFTPLARLTNLQQLNLNYTRVNDFALLSRLTNLQQLKLGGTGMTNLAPLAPLTNLKHLNLSHTRVTDLTPLAGLSNLQRLWLDSTDVTDLAPLARLTNLHGLWFDGTGVTDLAPLGGLKSLRALWVPKKTISQAQVDSLLRDVPDCKIERK